MKREILTALLIWGGFFGVIGIAFGAYEMLGAGWGIAFCCWLSPTVLRG
jgi:hypothetical protein